MSGSQADQPIALLKFLCSVEFASAQEIDNEGQQLRDLYAAIHPFRGSNALQAARLARAIWAAQRVHAHEGDQACPVCEMGKLDDELDEGRS